MKRRGFIQRAAVWLASMAGAVVGISFLKQFAHNTSRTGNKVRVGRLSDFPVDTYTFVEKHAIFIYRDHEAIRAVSAVCTHLGCTIQRTTDGFECPCHGSCYSNNGEVISGPAPSPLSWYSLEKAPNGDIIVDMETSAGADEKFYLA